MRKTVTALVFAAISLCAAGPLCARTPAHKSANTATTDSGSPYWQCVTFARNLTGMQIFGDAWTWWEKATGKYEEGQSPKPGAVLVFRSQGRMVNGHVAVVSRIITERYIQVTHANWSPVDGRRGRVEEDVNVMDVSDRGDWSKVKVWYGPLNDLGTTVYATYGFIYQDTPKGQAAARQMIAQSDGVPADDTDDTDVAAPAQLAVANVPADVPADLKAALTPANARGKTVVSKSMLAAAQVKGSTAHKIIAQIDADADGGKAVKTSSKSSKSKKSKAHAAKGHKATKLSAKSHGKGHTIAAKASKSKGPKSKIGGQKSAKKHH